MCSIPDESCIAAVSRGLVLVLMGSADVAFALIDSDIVDFEFFWIDHVGVNLSNSVGILEEGEWVSTHHPLLKDMQQPLV